MREWTYGTVPADVEAPRARAERRILECILTIDRTFEAQVNLTMCVHSNQNAARRVVVIYVRPIPRSNFRTTVPSPHASPSPALRHQP